MPTIDNPILNSAFAEPARHWRLDEHGIPTGEASDGRRRSEYIVPVPPPRHVDNAQGTLAREEDRGERKSNDYVNERRAKVAAWRGVAEAQWQRTVTPVTARLLRYWRDPERTRRLFFCQIEAVETAIRLAEAAPRPKNDRLRALNAEANPDLFRVAWKLATGAGKTTVMGMVIACQTPNRHGSRNSSLFTDAFLVITLGVTIRDRLRVLMPTEPNSVYVALDLVPPDLRDALQSARVVIGDYHQFRRRETMDAPKLVKAILGGREGPIKTLETDGMMIARVCKDLLGRKQITVLPRIPPSFTPAGSKADYQPPKKLTQIHAVLPKRRP